MSARLRRWREKRQRQAANRAAIRSGHGLVSMDVAPPVPVRRGMHLDPHQVPVTLMQPAMDAGQPAVRCCGHGPDRSD